MRKVGVVGHFGNGLDLLNGQTVKTKIISSELKKKFGDDNVRDIDTHGGLRTYLKLPFLLLLALFKCNNVVFLPAQNGLKIIVPLLFLMNNFFHRKLHYVVIGGWMSEMIKKRHFLCYCLRKIDFIYVETTVMKQNLESMSFTNVEIMFNCKPLNIVSENDLIENKKEPFKLCIFSRIMKQKGIEHAVFAINKINEKFGNHICSLDIYGQIDENEYVWFDSLKNSFPQNVAYRGVVPFSESVTVLKKYTALLFPTLFFTEGIPGTIIDAYAAGLPVIASRWASFKDVIDEGITGFGYEFGSENQLYVLLNKIFSSSEILNKMKKNCIAKACFFLPNNAMKNFISNLG